MTACVLGLCSCDVSSQFEYTVSNSTDSILFVQYARKHNEQVTTVPVPSRSSAIVSADTSLDRLGSLDDEFLTRWFEQFEVLKDTFNGTKIRKEIASFDAWTYERDVEGHFGLIAHGTDRFRLDVRPEDY